MGALTNQDRIARHYRNPELYPLTPKEVEQLERWNMVDQLIRAGRPTRTIVGILQKDYLVSRATAYNDICDAKNFFGSFYRVDKDYWRDVVKDWVSDEIMKAKRLNDSKAVAMLTRNLIDLLGLNKEIGSEFDPEKFEAHTYQLQIVIGEQNFNLNMDKLNELPAAQLETLILALQSPKLSAAEYMAILDKPEIEDAAAEEVTGE